MDFTLSEEQRQIRDTVAEFVDEEIVPRAAEIDDTDEFPADLIEEMADLGLMGMPFPVEYGGAGLDYHSYAIGLAEISRGSGGLGTVVAAHTSLAGNMLYAFGDESQKEAYLTPLNTGDDIGAFALSEAEAGSDVPAMSTRAEREAGGASDRDGVAADSRGRRATSSTAGRPVDLERLGRGHGRAVREDRPRSGPEGHLVVRRPARDG